MQRDKEAEYYRVWEQQEDNVSTLLLLISSIIFITGTVFVQRS